MSDSLEAALAHPTTCQSCGARIIFAITTNATAMPIDVEPNPDGNVTLVAGPISPHATVHPKGGQVDLFGQADTRYMPHHATCPDADSWRRR